MAKHKTTVASREPMHGKGALTLTVLIGLVAAFAPYIRPMLPF